MTSLNLDVILYISSFLTLKDKNSLKLTNKENYNNIELIDKSLSCILDNSSICYTSSFRKFIYVNTPRRIGSIKYDAIFFKNHTISIKKLNEFDKNLFYNGFNNYLDLTKLLTRLTSRYPFLIL